jgi:MscS family membrane protein
MRRATAGLILLLCLGFASAQSIVQFRTPRAAGEHFMRAATEGRFEDAAQALDTSHIDATRRDAEGRSAAKELAYLLAAIRFDPSTLSEDQFAQPIILNRISDSAGTVVGEIVMARKNGAWLFTRDTVDNSVVMADAIREAEKQGTTGGVTDSKAPPALRSPRATMTTFMNAMNAGRVSEAVSTLDLSQINPVTRMDRGLQIASRLAAILNRTQYFVLGTLPEQAVGDTYTLASYRDANGAPLGDITLTKDADDAWRFSTSSIDALDRIWEDVQHRPVIAGLRDVDLTEQDPTYKIRSISPNAWLRPAFGGLAWWQIIWFAIFVVCAAIFGLLARLLMAGVLKLKLRFEVTAIPDRVIRRTGFSLSLLVGSLALRRGVTLLGFYGWLSSSVLVVTEILAGIGTVGVLWGIWEATVVVIGRRLSGRSKRINSLFIPVLRQFGLLVIASSMILYTISRLGVNVTGVLAGLGIGGAILALAAKDSIENLFGSVTILFEAPFGIGDWVKVGDVEGTVEEISLRSTRIRTFADSIIVLPNRTLTTSPVENFGRRRYRRFKTTLGLSPLTPADAIREFSERIRTHLGERADVWQEKKRVWFNDFDTVGLRILVDTYIIAPDLEHELATRDEILRFILNTADELGVNFAFPASPVGVDRTPETPKDI